MADVFRLVFSRLLNLADLRAIDITAIRQQSYPSGEPEWTPEQMPDQTGRTALITGGNTGIGKECARALLRRNANVYIACRSRQKAQTAIEELYESTGKTAHFIELDLCDLNSVKAATDEFMSKEQDLHILINNAGVVAPMDHTCNGYDTHIHVHVLGHFYLTKLLLPSLLRTTTSGQPPRVVHMSSVMHYIAKAAGLDFLTFKCGAARDRQTTVEMYIQSKIANVILSKELARRYGTDGLISIAANPGNSNTFIARDFGTTRPLFAWLMSCVLIYPPSQGAITPLWAAAAPETQGYSGKFLIPWAKLGSAHAASEDPRLGEALWEWLEEQVRPL